MQKNTNHLIRGLNLVDSTSIVICSIIGTGIFLKTAAMAQLVGSPALVMAAWVAAGLLSLAGALTYAELSSMIPKAGGDYVYLHAAFGDAPAFLYGWMYFTVGGAGAAALGVAFATFLQALIPVENVWMENSFILFGHEYTWQFGTSQLIAVTAIIGCTVINFANVTFSGRVQTFFTVTKMAGIVVLIIGVFFFTGDVSWKHTATMNGTTQWCGMKAFGAAMLASLWAYNGWSFLPMVAGEVKNPGRTIPRAIMIGMFLILIVYGVTNLAYIYALPFEEVVSSNSTAFRDALPVASKAAQSFLGPLGIKLITITFLLSTLGTLHSEMLAIPRIHYAMARDGLFFSCFGPLSSGTHVPVWAVGFQAVWACILACSGTFDQLTTLLIFALWIFFGLTASSIFVLRRKMPDVERPYRTIGYPAVPFVFVLVALWLVVNTVVTNPVESVFGIGLIVMGVPLFVYFRGRKV